MNRKKRLIAILLIIILCIPIISPIEVNAGSMTVGNAGIELIKRFEGCRLTAYKAVSTEKYYTIGWGHYGADVYAGMTISQAEADALLISDLQKYCRYVNNFLDKYGIIIGQAQFDALVSFTYNLGNVWVSTPTFKLKTYLINGVSNYSQEEIRTAFTNWNKSNGVPLEGLTRRRNAEADLFLQGYVPRCTCSEAYAGNYTCTSTKVDLRIRSGHGTSYPIVGTIPPGATVYVSKASGTSASDWAHVEYNGVSGYASMQYLSKKEQRNLKIKRWLSEDGMGEEISSFQQGKRYYLCYKLYDANTNELLDSFSDYSYTVTETFYWPDGTSAGECSYNNDNNWFSLLCSVAGTYSYRIELKGDISGTFTDTFFVKEDPVTLTTSIDNVDLIIGETESQIIQVTKKGYCSGRVGLKWELNNSNVSCSWGELNGTTVPLTICAQNKGTTLLTIYALNVDTNEVLTSVTITVNVKQKSYTLYYDANGGSGAPTSQTKLHGTDLTLSSTKPTRDGYTFLGWNISANATTAKYQVGDKYTLNESVKLYAIWQSNVSITSQPTNVNVTEGQTASFTVKASGSNLKYQWQYYDTENGEWKNSQASGNTTATLQIKGMSAQNGEKYRCLVTDGMGNKVISNSATLTVTTSKPSTVSGLQIGGRATDALRLNWNKNSNASGYIIEQYKNGKWTRIARIGSDSTTTYRVEKLSASTSYKFRVQSFVLNGNTATYSDWKSIEGKTLPTTIGGLKIGGRATDALRLNWNKNSNASGYIIEQYKDGKWTRIAKIQNNSTTTYRIEKLSGSTTYKFRVQSYSFDGSTPLYSSWQTIGGKTLPTTVGGLKIGGRATDALRLNWNKNSNASGYIIEQYKDGKWTRIAKIQNNSTTTYRIEGLSASASYNFRVQSYSFDGSTPLYSSWQSISGKTLPTTVSGLRIGGRATDALRLNWDKNSNASGYIIEQYKNGKWTRIAKIQNNSTTTYRVEKLSKSTTYKFRVQTYNFDGNTAIYSSWQYVNGLTK